MNINENDKLLDKVLCHFLYINNIKKDYKLTIEESLKTLNSNIKDWQIDFIKDKLISDNYIHDNKYRSAGGPYEITSSGISFIQRGGYSKLSKNEKLDEELKIESLKSAKRSKHSLKISVIALVISFIVLCITILNFIIQNKDLIKHKEKTEIHTN